VKVPFADGEYQVTWLGEKVGLLDGFEMPGKGYTVLAGHNHLNTTEAGPFAMLSSMTEGDRIMVRYPNNDLKMYVVYANEKVSETDYDAVEKIAVKYDGSLTMITCEDERVDSSYANRRIIAAKPF
jgi:LPXTG-site transpeptidase (sortase) family protein